MEHDISRRFEFLALCRALCRHSKSQRYVVHAEYDDPTVLGHLVGHATEAGLGNVVAVEELHLGGGLYPHLVEGVLVDDVEGCGRNAREATRDMLVL